MKKRVVFSSQRSTLLELRPSFLPPHHRDLICFLMLSAAAAAAGPWIVETAPTAIGLSKLKSSV